MPTVSCLALYDSLYADLSQISPFEAMDTGTSVASTADPPDTISACYAKAEAYVSVLS